MPVYFDFNSDLCVASHRLQLCCTLSPTPATCLPVCIAANRNCPRELSFECAYRGCNTVSELQVDIAIVQYQKMDIYSSYSISYTIEDCQVTSMPADHCVIRCADRAILCTDGSREGLSNARLSRICFFLYCFFSLDLESYYETR